MGIFNLKKQERNIIVEGGIIYDLDNNIIITFGSEESINEDFIKATAKYKNDNFTRIRIGDKLGGRDGQTTGHNGIDLKLTKTNGETYTVIVLRNNYDNTKLYYPKNAKKIIPSDKKLKKYCINFINDNRKDIVDFHDLKEDNPKKEIAKNNIINNIKNKNYID